LEEKLIETTEVSIRTEQKYFDLVNAFEQKFDQFKLNLNEVNSLNLRRSSENPNEF